MISQSLIKDETLLLVLLLRSSLALTSAENFKPFVINTQSGIDDGRRGL